MVSGQMCCLPYGEEVEWEEMAVVVHVDELQDLKDILLSYSAADIDRMLKKGQEVRYPTLILLSLSLISPLHTIHRLSFLFVFNSVNLVSPKL